MMIFHCVECGAALTSALTPLSAVPEPPPFEQPRPGARGPEATIPRGHYAIETDPWGAPYEPYPDDEDGPAQRRAGGKSDMRGSLRSAGPRGNIVLHPDDATGLTMLVDTSMGCCGGPSGDQGLNRACRCGTPVATLAADCTTVYELHLDANSVRADKVPD
ncbi:hypothetical protein ACIRPK_36495 [Kitasatospora sp. NPDC101801]|uniref:hypothetical protein n=1 Tax=Kitasatospora sp. NPDC101801 TaxID=3364103 RepID=UPI0037F46AB4